MKKMFMLLMVVMSLGLFAGDFYINTIELDENKSVDVLMGTTNSDIFVTEDGYDSYLVVSLYSEKLPAYFNDGDSVKISTVTTDKSGKVKESFSNQYKEW